MRKPSELTLTLVTSVLLFTACGWPAAPVATALPPTQAADTPAATTVQASMQPQRIAFEMDDSTRLVGTFYPPIRDSAAGILLMHQMGANRTAWQPLIDAVWGPGTPDYAVFAFDFPGHGESGGTISDAAALAAARSAFTLIQAMDGVDPARIVNIGASIGADAAADSCSDGCIGVVSVSPGGYLGIPYDDALNALKTRGVPVLCLASAQDQPPAKTCQGGESVGLTGYQMHIYDGGLHGNGLVIKTDRTPGPQPIPLILAWLAQNAPPAP